MKKRIVVISTTLRTDGNSDILSDAFANGAKEAGHEVLKVSLRNKQISFCTGCLSCQKTKQCVIQDDANDIVAQMIKSDVIVFATPIYFYEMCGQMKTLLDRSNPAFTTDYAFREIYLIATAADTEKIAMDNTIKGLQGWIDCFEKASLSCVIYGTDLTQPRDIKNHSDLLAEAFEKGKLV